MKKGITLVALVVTIVILLILASVTISMLIGNDGVVSRTTESKSKTQIHEVIERLNNASSAVITDSYYGLILDISNISAVRARLIQNDSKDTDIINAMTKNPTENIYTINYTPLNSKFTLVYTLNLVNRSTSHVVNEIP